MPSRDVFVDLFEWCKSERQNLQRQLEMLTSGKFRISENRGSSWVDKTGASIERVTASIDELDQIIAEYNRVCKVDRGPQGENHSIDMIGTAVMVAKRATGEIQDTRTENNPHAVAFGRNRTRRALT
jgi:hypothetical protein